jgi:hypothetical protein
MAAIPTIPNSEQVQSVQRGVKRNLSVEEGPLSAARGAIQAADQSIQGMVGVVEDYEERKRRAKEAAFFNQTTLHQINAQTEFTKTLRQQPYEKIPENWSHAAQGTMDSLRDSDQYQAMSPAAKRLWGQKAAVWQASTTSDFQVTSDHLGITTRNGNLNALMDKGATTGDESVVPAVKQAIGMSVKTGDLTPEQGEDKLRQFQTKFAVGQASNLIETKPQRVKEKLAAGDWKEIPENLRNHLTTQATTQERANLNLLPTNPLTRQVDDQTIDDAIAGGTIDLQQGELLKKTQKLESSRADRDVANRIMAGVHDSVAWKGADNPDNYANDLAKDLPLIRDDTTRKDTADRINKQLAAVKKTGQTEEKPVEQQIHQLINDDLRSQGAMIPVALEDIPAKQRGLFHWGAATPPKTVMNMAVGGLTALEKKLETDKDWPLPGVSMEKATQAAQVHAAEIHSQMSQWFKTEEGQKADLDKAVDHLHTIERPFVEEAVKQTLQRRAPVQITSPDEVKNLPSGMPFLDPQGNIRYAK